MFNGPCVFSNDEQHACMWTELVEHCAISFSGEPQA
jgi:hypothetical protein